MKQKLLMMLALAVMLVLGGKNVWGQVIISQYYEGASNDKWIELTNVGSASVDLSNYYLARWSGTSSPSGSPTNYDQLSGSIAAGEVLLYKHASSVLPSYASGTSTTACYFNGDDPVALCDGSNDWSDRVDCIYASISGGKWGENTSFYRKADVLAGNTAISVLDGSGEWTEVTNAAVDGATSDLSEYLGTHIYNSTSPTISLSETSLTGFTYNLGNGPSAEQSFTVTGSNLTDHITITPPADYEISTGTGASFVATDPITLTQTGGSVTTTDIYVRLKAELAANTYNNELITCTSESLSETVECSGTVIGTPEPSAHVTGFAASTITTNAIPLGWTDSGADYYLIKAVETGGTITPPVDGTAKPVT